VEPRTLAGGLVLRTAIEADAEALEAFNRRVHGTDGSPAAGIGAWARDLALGRHPTFRAADFLVVTEPREDAIVSSLNLIAQRWTYDGVGFGVGQPELVGTDSEYRKRGLVRDRGRRRRSAPVAERGSQVGPPALQRSHALTGLLLAPAESERQGTL